MTRFCAIKIKQHHLKSVQVDVVWVITNGEWVQDTISNKK